MSGFKCHTRSDSSKEMRDSLMASEADVPDIRITVPLSRYKQYAYSLFRTALTTTTEGYISRSYVAWKWFLSFIAHKLPQHPKFRVSDTTTKQFKEWAKEASTHAFNELEKIVEQMDREEDAARGEVASFEDGGVVEQSDDDFLLDQFDCLDGEGDSNNNNNNNSSSKQILFPSSATPSPAGIAGITGVTSVASAGLVNKLKILEMECNSQLEGGGGKDSGAGLFEHPSVEDQVPSGVSSALGIKPNDRNILRLLLGEGGHNLRNIPPPQRLLLQLKFSTPQGNKQINFHRHDFYISFLRFFSPPRGWGGEQQQLKNSREAIETNRCFFIHLGVAINVHPFALQTYFRHVAATIVAKSQDDLQKEIVQSVLNYSGFVDANSLMYIWPLEMQRYRICLISGDLHRPIFCSFAPSHVDVDTLDDVIIHSDGSHFTLLKPAAAENSKSFSVLSKLLEAARSAGCIIQEIPVDMAAQASLGVPLSVGDVFRNIAA